MKTIKSLLLLTSIFVFSCTQQESVRNESPIMEMTTGIPEGISTPNKVDTRIGELNFFDGVPKKETADKVYDYLDFHYAVDAYIKGIQIASMEGLKRGLLPMPVKLACGQKQMP